MNTLLLWTPIVSLVSAMLILPAFGQNHNQTTDSLLCPTAEQFRQQMDSGTTTGLHHLPDARHGNFFEYIVGYQGLVEPVQFCWYDEMPDGISENGALLSGTPNVTSDTPFRFSVGIEDALGQMFLQEFSLLVRPQLEPLRLETEQLPTFIKNEPVSFRIAASYGEGSYQWSVGEQALPTGLVLQCNSEHEHCVLTGTPTETGEIRIDLSVADSVGRLPSQSLIGQVIALPIPPPPITICEGAMPSAILGMPFNYRLCASGGYPPYRWYLRWAENSVPDWLNIDLATGILTGVPTTIAEHSFSVNVSDRNRAADSQDGLVLKVKPPPSRGPLKIVPKDMP